VAVDLLGAESSSKPIPSTPFDRAVEIAEISDYIALAAPVSAVLLLGVRVWKSD
jgi:hypothetical protein